MSIFSKKSTSDPCFPQRWVIASMGFFAFFNAYTLRMCLSIAITKMTVPLNITEESTDETCPNYENHVSNSITIVPDGGTFEWSEYTQGIILSSFYWGYVLTHVPGGLLAQKFGAKYTLGLGVLFTAILTLLTPPATYWGDAKALIFVRFLMGLCEGVIQPGVSTLLAHWIPPNERSVTASLVYTGSRIGSLISTVVSGLIIGRFSNNWSLIFYLFGVTAVVWFLFYVYLCYSSPKEHPFISREEKAYLQKQMGSDTHDRPAAFPWKRALTSKPFIALALMQSGQDWCNYTIMSDLPKYMNNVLKLPVEINGYASSIHHVTSWVFCMAMSTISDWLIAKGHASITNVRKMNAAISSLPPAILLILAMYVGCDVFGAVSLITLGLTFQGSSIPGIKVNVLDLSPNYAGTLMGIANGTGAIMGVLAPYIVGILAPNQTLTEWRLIFWIVGGVYLVTTMNFMVFASGEVQEWNDPDSLDNKRKELENKRNETVELVGKDKHQN